MTTAPEADAIEATVERAKGGDKAALDTVMRHIQDRVYTLALRMLWHPADAEDAAQEILVKVMTHLSQFEGRSAFTTWVYRVATNHLLTTRERQAELAMRVQPPPDDTDDTDLILPDTAASPEEEVLLTEMQTQCSLGMMLCLDRELRVAFILGVGFGVSGDEGAAILDTTPAAYRKRLSRARGRMRGFMEGKCHLVNPAVACSCESRAGFAAYTASVFAGVRAVAPDAAGIAPPCGEIGDLDRVAILFRSHPAYAAPDTLVATMRSLLRSGQYPLLN